MKLNKYILAAGMTLGVVGLTEAGTVYITGSTALRGQVRTALLTSGTVFNAVPTFTGYDGAGAGANYMAFRGNDLSGNPLLVQCHWSGSEAGIKDVAVPQSGTFMHDIPGVIDGVDHGVGTTPASFDTATVDLAMADNAQEFSRNTTPTLFTNKFVGIITFKWVRNPGLWTGLGSSNVSSAQIQQALIAAAPRSLFDGDTTHQGDYVYVSGRDSGSGTRVNAFGDSGFGILTPPTQMGINTADGQMIDWDSGPGTQYSGDVGFSSGGTLAGTLGTSTVGKTDQINGGAGGYSVIAYLSNGDAGTAITAGATELTLNGVKFSRDAIIEGNYSFWGNAHIFQRQSPVASAQAQAVFTKLANGGIETAIGHASASAIPIGDMHAARSGPNAVPGHL